MSRRTLGEKLEALYKKHYIIGFICMLGFWGLPMLTPCVFLTGGRVGTILGLILIFAPLLFFLYCLHTDERKMIIIGSLVYHACGFIYAVLAFSDMPEAWIFYFIFLLLSIPYALWLICNA